MLTVTTAASDPGLLSIAELRTVAGLASGDSSRDAELTVLGARTARVIAAACKIVRAGVTVPTLRLETLTEVLRPEVSRRQISLARRPVVAISSVTEDGETVAASGYEIDAAAGLLLRLDASDEPSCWAAAKITLVYSAGWETVPDDLKEAAAKLSAVFLAEGRRADPNLKRENIPGVIEREWWIPPTADPAIPNEVMDLLAPYIEHWT